MKTYFSKHKWHLLIFVCLIFIASISGFYSFRTSYSGLQTPVITIDQTDETEQTTINTNEERSNEINEVNFVKTSSTNFTDVESIIPDKNQTTLTVNDEEYSINIPENTTVYKMMQLLTLSSARPFIFETKEFTGLGHFVDSINEVKNDPRAGKYWIYYINGQSAQIGISNYIIQKEDKIEWKYEKSNI